MTFFRNSMKALVLGGSLLLGTTLSHASAATAKPMRVGPVQNYGTLGTDGNKIVSLSSKKQVMLRGMSMFWSDATGLQYYNKNVMKWAVENLKVDVIRYAMGIQYYDSQGGTSGAMDENYSYKGNPDKQKSTIDLMVEAAIENDIYIIIDWHSHRADQEQSLAVAFFKEMAAKYKDVPNIIWEVFNEPVNQGMSTIASYANAVISGIRSAGSQNLALVGTPRWSQMGECGGVNQTNTGYVFHFYAASHSKGSYSGNIDRCRSQGNAVFITEWGTTTADGKGGASVSASQEWESYMESNKISNCNWSLRNEVSTIGEQTSEGSALFAGSEFLNTVAKLNGATYTTSGSHIKSYLESHGSAWADTLVASKPGACSFKSANVKASVGSLAAVYKSGCTYTSSDPTVVANDGTVLKPGLSILTANDGSISVAVIEEEPTQTYSGFDNVNCYVGGTCTKSKTIKDLDGDGKLEVVIGSSNQTAEGAKITFTSLNPEILSIKQGNCTSKFCYALQGETVPMYAFTGTYGSAKVVATAPAVSGYNAMNDTVTITYTKGEDKPGQAFKATTVAKGATVANFFPATTYYGKQAITYTFDGKATSPYLSNVNGSLVAGTEDAIVSIRATAAESENRAAMDMVITVVVGDSLAAVTKGNTPILPTRKEIATAKFSRGGILLSAAAGGFANVEIFSAMGKMEQSIQSNLTAGENWIPVSGLRAGRYIVRIRQDGNMQFFTLNKK